MTPSSLLGIVLAGGLGTRLKSVTQDLPKVLVPAEGKPFLYRLLNEFQNVGFLRMGLALGYKAALVSDQVRGWDLKMQIHCYDENKKLDTGGAIKNVLLGEQYEGAFLVSNGDSIVEKGLSDFLKETDSQCSWVALVSVNDASRFGTVVVDPVTQEVTKFEEKKGIDEPGLIYAGISILHSPEILQMKDEVFSLERDFFPKLISQKKLKAVILEGWFCDIGLPEDYKKFCDRLKQESALPITSTH